MDITDREIEKYEDGLAAQLDSYRRIIDFRYKNLLVKACAEQMLPVEVENPDEGMVPLETVAMLGITADDQFTIITNDPDMLTNVQRGIFKTHPLIKQEVVEPNLDDNEEMQGVMQAAEQALGHKPEPVKTLLLTLPPMTKERRDVVKGAVDTLKKSCKLKFLEALEENKIMMAARVVVLEPDRIDEGIEKLTAKHDEAWKGIEDLTTQFLKDVDERYEAYLASNSSPAIVEERTNNISTEEKIQSGMSIKLGHYEE